MRRRDIILGLLALLTVSCTTERKAIKYLDKHPEVSSLYCSKEFPVKEFFIQGKEILKTDTLLTRDTVIVVQEKDGKTEYIKVPCPGSKTITKFVYRTDTAVKENTAKVEYLNIQIVKTKAAFEQEKEDKEKAEKTAKERLWYLIGLSLVLLGGLFIKLKF